MSRSIVNDLSNLSSLGFSVEGSDYGNCLDVSSAGLEGSSIPSRHFLMRIDKLAVPDLIAVLQEAISEDKSTAVIDVTYLDTEGVERRVSQHITEGPGCLELDFGVRMNAIKKLAHDFAQRVDGKAKSFTISIFEEEILTGEDHGA